MTDEEIIEASRVIANAIGKSVLELAPNLMAKYQLTAPELSVAIVGAILQLLAAGAAGAMLGSEPTEKRIVAKANWLLHQIRPVIAAGLEV